MGRLDSLSKVYSGSSFGFRDLIFEIDLIFENSSFT